MLMAMCADMCMRICMDMGIDVCMDLCRDVCMDVCMAQMDGSVETETKLCVFDLSGARPRPLMYVCTHLYYMFRFACVQMCTNAWTHTLFRPHTRLNERTHARTHVHMHGGRRIPHRAGIYRRRRN